MHVRFKSGFWLTCFVLLFTVEITDLGGGGRDEREGGRKGEKEWRGNWKVVNSRSV